MGLISQRSMLTLNQRVQGSSPCAPTIKNKHLIRTLPEHRGPVGRSVGSSCSPFELPDCALGKRRIAAQVVRVEDRAHAAQRMTGDGGNLCLGTSTDRKPRYCRSAQVVKCDPHDTGALAGLAPRCPKAVRRPWLAVAVGQDRGRAFRHRIEHGLERCTNRNYHPAPLFTAFGLAQADMFAVIGGPRKPQQIPREAWMRKDGKLRIELRWGAGDADRIGSLAKELVDIRPGAIFSVTTPVIGVLARETRACQDDTNNAE
jgi:hypothetical protein